MLDSVIHFNSNLIYILPASFAFITIVVRLVIAHIDYRTQCKNTASRLFFEYKRDIDGLMESVYSRDRYTLAVHTHNIVKQAILSDPLYPIMLKSYKRALEKRCKQYLSEAMKTKKGSVYFKPNDMVDELIDFSV